MLGKLMKYEFRATAIYFLPIYAMLILVSGLRYAVSLITEKFSGSCPGRSSKPRNFVPPL